MSSHVLQVEEPDFVSQEQVYKDIGEEMLLHAFEGNAYPFTMLKLRPSRTVQSQHSILVGPLSNHNTPS